MTDFLITVFCLTLSGALAPGPITAATLAAGAINRHAGAWVCAGHMAVELPLILLLVGGLGRFLESPQVRTGIGMAGGVVLLLMGLQLAASLRKQTDGAPAAAEQHPLWIGVVLSGANPYFLVWWATVGLRMVGDAMALGSAALVLLAAIHWTLDLGWLEVLSLAGFKGSQVFGDRCQRAITAICALMLLGFGVKFVCEAAFPATPAATEVRAGSPYRP